MSNIPQARLELSALADRLPPDYADELRCIVDAHLFRELPARRAPRQRNPVTPELAEKIRQYTEDHPTITMSDIGRHFGVDGGRVSECVNHLR